MNPNQNMNNGQNQYGYNGMNNGMGMQDYNQYSNNGMNNQNYNQGMMNNNMGMNQGYNQMPMNGGVPNYNQYSDNGNMGFQMNNQNNDNVNKPLIIVLIIVLLIALAGGIYALVALSGGGNDDSSSKSSSSSNSSKTDTSGKTTVDFGSTGKLSNGLEITLIGKAYVSNDGYYNFYQLINIKNSSSKTLLIGDETDKSSYGTLTTDSKELMSNFIRYMIYTKKDGTEDKSLCSFSNGEKSGKPSLITTDGTLIKIGPGESSKAYLSCIMYQDSGLNSFDDIKGFNIQIVSDTNPSDVTFEVPSAGFSSILMEITE